MFNVDFHPDRDLAYFGSDDLGGFFGTKEKIEINMRHVITNPPFLCVVFSIST